MTKTAYVDFDGTIVDVFPRFYGVLTSYLGRLTDEKLEYESYKQLKRVRKKDHIIVKDMLGGLQINIEEYVEYKRKKLESFEWLQKDVVIGNPEDAYEKLKLKGYRVILLTQRNNEKNLVKQIKYLGLNHCFDDLVVVKPQHRKNVKMHYIKDYSQNKDIIIGDSKVEMEAAKILNIEGYFVDTGLYNSSYAQADNLIFKNYNCAVDFILNR